MGTRHKLILAVFCLVASRGAFAAPSDPDADSDVASASTAQVLSAPSRFVLVPQISVMNPSGFALTTDDYVAHYAKSQFGIPAVVIGGAYRLGSRQNLEFFLDGKVGYGGKSGVIGVSARHDGVESPQSFSQDVRLHWMPIEVGPRVLWSIPGVTFLRPTLSAGLGSALTIQTSSLPGFSHTYLLPFFRVTPGLTFLEGNRAANDWFGGFLFGFSYLQTFATEQKMHGTSVDLSVNILL